MVASMLSRRPLTGLSGSSLPPRCARTPSAVAPRKPVAIVRATTARQQSPQAAPHHVKGITPASTLLAAAASWLSVSAPAAAAVGAAASGAVEEAAGSSLSAAGLDLAVYLAKTLISWGVPGGVALVLVLVATSRGGKKGKGAGEVDDEDDKTPGFLKQFKRKGDSDAPKEYLKVVPLNDRLDSYSYSLAKVTGSKAKATADNRRRQYTKKFNDFLGELEDEQVSAVLAAEKVWVKEAAAAQSKVDTLAKELRSLAIKGATPRGEKKGDGNEEDSGMGSFLGGGMSGRVKAGRKALGEAVAARAAADDKYLAAVAAGLNKEQQTALAGLIKQGAALGWQDGENPMALAPVGGAAPGARVFVLKFNGNVQASQVKNLREEVTAIVQSGEARPGDEVVLILNTGGGTVTGYGLAAAQLTRLKAAGFKLTVCVEQVAASGGYMMACCADRLVASPFAVLGSIGVISEQPNVYDRLKREGIEFQTVTAGKFKRTLTPFKKPTTEDFEKNKEDIEKVLVLFKNFVASQRPQLDIDTVATGETWFGADAFDRGLCDELKTTDEVLLELRAAGARLFELRFQEPSMNPLAQLAGAGASFDQMDSTALSRLLSPASNLFQTAVQEAVARQLNGAGNGLRDRTRLEDKSADGVQLSDGEDAPADLWWM